MAAYLDLVGGVDRHVEDRVRVHPLFSLLSEEGLGLVLRLSSLPEHDPGLGHHVEPSSSLLTDEGVVLRLSPPMAHDPGLGLRHEGQADAPGKGRQRLNATGHQLLPGVALVKIGTYGLDLLPSSPVPGPRQFDLSS